MARKKKAEPEVPTIDTPPQEELARPDFGETQLADTGVEVLVEAYLEWDDQEKEAKKGKAELKLEIEALMLGAEVRTTTVNGAIVTMAKGRESKKLDVGVLSVNLASKGVEAEVIRWAIESATTESQGEPSLRVTRPEAQ